MVRTLFAAALGTRKRCTERVLASLKYLGHAGIILLTISVFDYTVPTRPRKLLGLIHIEIF